MRGIATTLDNERMDAFNSVMKDYPDIKLLDAKYANWNRDDAFKVMQDYLTRFKQIDAVWAADDDMAVGVLKAIEQAKRDDIKIVFGGAGSRHDQDADRRQGPAHPGQRLLLAEVHLRGDQADGGGKIEGEALPATTIVPSVLITKDNAKDFYFPDSPF